MSIQRRKAQELGIAFVSTYVNILESDSLVEFQNYSPIIICDEQRIMQVLLSLQSNALKFTKEGSVAIIVEILKVNENKFLQISVKDTGVGISKKD